LVVLEGSLEEVETSLLECSGSGSHRVELGTSVRSSSFEKKERGNVVGLLVSIPAAIQRNIVTYQTHHDLAEQHVLQCPQRSWILFIVRGEPFESFEEVGVASLVVFVVGIESTRL
jgi:hypothetical protein